MPERRRRRLYQLDRPGAGFTAHEDLNVTWPNAASLWTCTTQIVQACSPPRSTGISSGRSISDVRRHHPITGFVLHCALAFAFGGWLGFSVFK